MKILPEVECRGLGVVIRGRLPNICYVCGASTPFAVDYDARDIADAIPYKCNHCATVEYVDRAAPTIIA